MPRATQFKSKAAGISRATGIVLLVSLVIGWPGPAWSAEEPVSAPSLQLAPIRMGLTKTGSLGYSLLYDKTGNGYNMRQLYGFDLGVGVNAESFLWQPWIAQTGAHVGVSYGFEMMDSASNSMRMIRSGESRERSVAGGVSLRILPMSRFPFAANFERSDSRSEVGLIRSKYATLYDVLDLTQSYRPRYGGHNILAFYRRGRREDLQSRVVKNENVSLDVSLYPQKFQTANINLTNSRNENSDSGTTVLNNKLVGRHTFRPNSAFSTATLASLTGATYRLTQGGESGYEALQLSSDGTWRTMGSDLTMTGGLRLFDSSSKSGGSSTQGASYTGANFGASYALSTWLRLYGSASVSDSQGTQTVASTSLNNLNLSLAAQHRPRTLRVGVFDYSRYIAANLSNNVSSSASSTATGTTTSSSASQVFTLRLQHGLSNGTALGAGRLTSSLTQSLSGTAYYNPDAQDAEPSATLQHGGSLAWQGRGILIRVNGSDSRALRGSKSYFQQINLQGSQSEKLPGYQTLRGDMTVNASRQGYGASSAPTTDSLTATASLNYSHRRAFNVRDMIFQSSLRLISNDLLQSSDMNQNFQNQGQYFWENELTYTIGKLEAEFKGIVEDIKSSQRITLFFRVRRSF